MKNSSSKADLLDNYEPLPTTATPANRALYAQVERLGIDVDTIVPIHGQPLAWEDFLQIIQ